MRTLARVRSQLTAGEFDLSEHAFRRAVERDISERETREAGAGAVVVEEYPSPTPRNLCQVTVMTPYMCGQGVDSRLRGNDGFMARPK